MSDVMAAIRQSIENGSEEQKTAGPVRVADALAEAARRREAPAPPAAPVAVPANGRTVEELAADLLEPMLRDWLDTHLPGIVERVVREEVSKVTRR